MKKKRRSQKTVFRRGSVLPNDACPACGTMMVKRRGTLRLAVNGEEIPSRPLLTGGARSAERSCCAEVLRSHRVAADAAVRVSKNDALHLLGTNFPVPRCFLADLTRGVERS